MRPHRLRLTAFGPFPGPVDLDLDEVSGAGPFLLRGATGAGKTSLLDAVGYALFGRVPGARGLKQLRSDHADDATRTSVELWATVAGRAVHVVRSPDQRRPRSRGTGWTTDKATVSVRVARDLAALDADDCDARWTGVQEANSELADLVGMTHEQFVQVVLLPQGDFARFLRAKDEDRADVLRALFDSSRFTAVEQLLKERRDTARAALAEADAAVATAAGTVAAHAGLDERPDTDLTSWARELLEQAEEATATAAGAATEADDVVATTRARHTDLLTRTRLLSDLVTAAGTRRDLLRSAPVVAGRARELDEADRAAEVVALHEAHRAGLVRADEAVEAARDALTGLPDDVEVHDPDLGALTGPPDVAGAPDVTDLADLDADAVVALAAGLERHVDHAVTTNAALVALGRDVERWQAVQTDLTARRGEQADAEAAVDAVRARAAELPDRVQAVTAELEDLQRRASLADGALREVERWQGAAELAARLATLTAAVDVAERADLAAREQQRAAEEHLDRLRRARLDGMATELAATLVDGEPCGVCGSTVHPAPAGDGDPAVDAHAEEQARPVAAAAAAAAALTAADVATAVTRREEAHAQLSTAVAPEVEVPPLPRLTAPAPPDRNAPADQDTPDDRTALDDLRDAVAGRLDRARAGRRAAEDAAATARATAEQLAALGQEQARLGAALTTAESTRERLAATVEALQEQAEQLRTGLREALGVDPVDEPPAAVWRRLAAAGLARLELLRAAGDAVDACVVALRDLGRARDAARAAAVEAGWDDVAAAVTAARPRAWREDARREVTAHGRDLHAATLRTDELSGQLGLPVPDDAESQLTDATAQLADARRQEADLAEQLADAERSRRSAEAALASARSVRDGLARSTPQLVDAERRAGPLRTRAQTTRALAELCSGANDRGIPLSTYVLAAHLQQVVEAANLRLDGMSDGRYALAHVEEGEDRRRRAGLGLAVLDAWTGRQRPAGTLSGGETFLASLALALGLADVVTAEAGGARIDALFVDEGFGTLDADSLDRAMDVLDQLQEHGRMVGVVSHVGELQQRLPRQVHVEHGRHGSTVRVRTG